MQLVGDTIQQHASILIIDANSEDLKVLGNILKKHEYEVLIATTAEQGIKLATNKKPSLVLLDASIGGEEKQGLYDLIKKNSSTTSIPVIFIAPSLNEVGIETSDFDDFICKPINEVELLNRIKIQLLLLNHRKKESAIREVLENEVKFQMDKSLSYIEKNITPSEVSDFISNLAHSIKKVSGLLETPNQIGSKLVAQESINNNANLKSVLIVEDNELNQILLDSILTEAGYKTFLESTGKGTLEALKKHPVNLVLMDVSLPDMSCSEIYSEMKSSGYHAPIVAVSGYTKTEILEKNPNLPFADFILKPVNADVLCDIVKRHATEELSIGQKEYDYSKAKKIAAGDSTELKKWVNEFLAFLKQGAEEIELLVGNQITVANREVTHGLLNYTVFFGASELKDFILELKEVEKDLSKKAPEQLLVSIKSEIKNLLQFYTNVEATL